MGGIGNGTWAHAPEPVKVKTISGLLECKSRSLVLIFQVADSSSWWWIGKEKSREIEPIAIKEIAVGKNHIAIVLVGSFLLDLPFSNRTEPNRENSNQDNAVEQPGGIKFGRDVFVWGQNEFYQVRFRCAGVLLLLPFFFSSPT